MNWNTIKSYIIKVIENITRYNCYEDFEIFDKNITGYLNLILKPLKDDNVIFDYYVDVSNSEGNNVFINVAIKECDSCDFHYFKFEVQALH